MTGRKKMKKRIIRLIGRLIAVIVLFLFLLIIQSARWYLQKFGELDISVAIYQMLSPLKGTSSSVLQEYCSACLFPALFITIIIAFLYQCYSAVTDKMYLDVHIQVYHYLTDVTKDYFLHFRERFRRISKIVISLVLVLAIITMVLGMAVKIGLPEYVKSISIESELIEQYYADPDDIKIIFPEQKRNLIVIYMESMESTFASEEAGGLNLKIIFRS